MPAMVFQESDIHFDFDPRYWEGRKYDEHTFFRGLCGAGLKGVDFLGIYRGRRLVMLEVKHFRYSGLLPDPEALAAEVSAKVLDTVKAIDAIHQYFERSWVYRVAEPLLGMFPAHRLEWPFWTRAYQLALDPGRVEVVFWAEAEKEPYPQAAPLEKKIRALLPEPYQVTLANRKNHHYGDSLRVN